MTTKKKAQPMKQTVPPKDPVYIRRMREYRFLHNLSQPEIADQLKMRQQLYSNLETGRTKLSVPFIKKYKELTGIDLMDEEESRLVIQGNRVVQKDENISECENLKRELEFARELIEQLKKQVALYEKIQGK